MVDKEYIEMIHKIGAMPDWAYYQLNGKDINENYKEIKQK